MNPISRLHTRPNGRHGIRILMAAAAATLLLASGCSMLPQEEETLAPPLKVPEKITYETMDVQKGSIERKIRVTGRFVSVAQSNVQFTERGGRLKSIQVKLGQKVKKGDILATLDTETLADDIKLQEIALQRAQISLDKAKRAYSDEVGVAKYELDKSQREIEANKARLQDDVDMAKLDFDSNSIRLQALRRALDESQMLSPIDGDVTYITDVKVGDLINTFSTVLTVADPTNLQLRYSEDRVGDFVSGMKVTVNFDNSPYDGEVVMTPVDLPIDATESMKNTILVAVKDLPAGIRIGADAQIVAVLDQRSDTIVLPKYALNKNFGRTYVNVLKNNLREERDVEIGIQSDTEVEILKGLEIGEQVIIR